MAGLSSGFDKRGSPASPPSQQFRAIAYLRWRLFANSFRRKGGAGELVSPHHRLIPSPLIFVIGPVASAPASAPTSPSTSNHLSALAAIFWGITVSADLRQHQHVAARPQLRPRIPHPLPRHLHPLPRRPSLPRPAQRLHHHWNLRPARRRSRLLNRPARPRGNRLCCGARTRPHQHAVYPDDLCLDRPLALHPARTRVLYRLHHPHVGRLPVPERDLQLGIQPSEAQPPPGANTRR